MKRKVILSCVFVPVGLSLQAQSPDRPNIIWLTIEDASAHEFGCYGNRQVKTPCLDSLAARGIQYMNAWSVAPQSSPARSSIITGCYATTYAMDLHRNRQKTPEGILFPQLLRKAGYYCTNNNKTDYNTALGHTACWDECEKNATYNSPLRKPDQPFFAVFNSMLTHMGRIRSFHLVGRRSFAESGLLPEKLILPPYLPDLREIRSDYAFHLEGVQDVDQWVRFFLNDLKKKGLDGNTIVFFYADHGGCSPRGKGYLNETGLRVPMIVYLPPRWQHLAPRGVGIRENRLVSFTDLAPTLFSMIGLPVPAAFQGKAFLGKQAAVPKKYQFAFTSNQHHNYMPSRAVTDGRFKYIRNYIPYKYASLRNYYQWGMPGNQAWDKLILSDTGQVAPVYWQPYVHRKAEMLFDLANDYFETNDLSANPAYQAKLQELRQALRKHVRDTKDLGFMIPSSRGSKTSLYELLRVGSYPLNQLYDLTEIASRAEIADLKKLTAYLTHKEPEFRFWAAVGMAEMAAKNVLKQTPAALRRLVQDPDDYVAAEACYALVLLEQNNDALKRLVTPRNEAHRKAGYSLLECLSLRPETRKLIEFCVPRLQESAQEINIGENEDPGMIARGILANLGLMEVSGIYGDAGYQMGLKTNKDRRKLMPVPDYFILKKTKLRPEDNQDN